MRLALVIVLGSAVLTTLFAFAQVAVARLFGLKAKTIVLFMGPVLLRRRIEVRLLPFSSRVDFGDQFARANRFVKAAIALTGPLSMGLVAVALLGPSHAAHAFASAPQQVVVGAFSPFTVGPALLERFYLLAPLTALGVFAAKITVVNLLPYPGSSGFMALGSLIGFQQNAAASFALFNLMLVVAGGWFLATLTSVGLLPKVMQGALGVIAVAIVLLGVMLLSAMLKTDRPA